MCAPRHPRCSSSRRGTFSLLGSTCRRQSEIGPHGHRNEPGFGVLRWIPLYCQGCAQENSVSCRSVAALLQVSSSDPPIACRRGTRPLIRCSARDLSLRAPSGAHYIRPPSAPKGGQRRRKDPHHSRSTGFRLRLSRDRTKTRAEHAESEVLRATVVREVERQRRRVLSTRLPIEQHRGRHTEAEVVGATMHCRAEAVTPKRSCSTRPSWAIGVSLAHTVQLRTLSCPSDRVFILTDWSCPSILNLAQCTFTQACVQIDDYRIADAVFIAAKASLKPMTRRQKLVDGRKKRKKKHDNSKQFGGPDPVCNNQRTWLAVQQCFLRA